jgi:hypothetical protein
MNAFGSVTVMLTAIITALAIDSESREGLIHHRAAAGMAYIALARCVLCLPPLSRRRA